MAREPAINFLPCHTLLVTGVSWGGVQASRRNRRMYQKAVTPSAYLGHRRPSMILHLPVTAATSRRSKTRQETCLSKAPSSTDRGGEEKLEERSLGSGSRPRLWLDTPHHHYLSLSGNNNGGHTTSSPVLLGPDTTSSTSTHVGSIHSHTSI